ncbi:MAG TPA: efflux RND transporter periplasmic adaptor subunit, partial [Burkholderiales bacterium]|nr:efflux RND transporter periplasmic adaptor subunit [Burkholderiales bacterium]
LPRRPRPKKEVRIVGNNGSARVWVLRDAQAVPVDVKTGATSGQLTEITSGDLNAGTQLITETVSARE